MLGGGEIYERQTREGDDDSDGDNSQGINFLAASLTLTIIRLLRENIAGFQQERQDELPTWGITACREAGAYGVVFRRGEEA